MQHIHSHRTPISSQTLPFPTTRLTLSLHLQHPKHARRPICASSKCLPLFSLRAARLSFLTRSPHHNDSNDSCRSNRPLPHRHTPTTLNPPHSQLQNEVRHPISTTTSTLYAASFVSIAIGFTNDPSLFSSVLVHSQTNKNECFDLSMINMN